MINSPKNKKTWSRSIFVVFLIAYLIFYVKGFFVLDPDFGWHLKAGEFILKYGIPKTDPFSYTMPDYPFIDHEWLSNVFIALVYPVAGMAGLAALFGVIALAPFIFFRNEKRFFPYFLLAAGVAVSFVGVRPQVFSWFFVSILFCLLRKNTLTPVVFAAIVLFQTVWANLHGGFFLGPVICFLFFIADSSRKKTVSTKGLLLTLSVFGASFANPYGARLWTEVGKSLSDYGLRWSIVEWMPAFTFLNICYWLYAGISISFFIYCRAKTTLFEKIVYAQFFVGGLASMRNIPLWVVISFPLLQEHMIHFFKNIPKTDQAEKKLNKVKKALLIMALAAFVLQMFLSYYDGYKYTEEKGYPKKAIRHISAKGVKGNIMAHYTWGGYLIWKLPSQKIFIDGRMPSWRRSGGGQKYSPDAYGEYKKALTGPTQLEAAAKKYNIEYFLFPSTTGKKGRPFMHLETIYKDSVATLYKIER